jgi:hypothetical protein
MEAQPEKLPEWASTGTIVEPDETKKDSGWEGTGVVPNEKPRYQYENWRANLVYLWLAWLRDNHNFGLTIDSPYFEITYDADDKVTDVDYYESAAKITLIAHYDINYDADDKVTSIVLDPYNGFTYTATITYDADDRVTSVSTVEA